MTLSYFGVFGAGVLTFLSPCVLPLIPILAASFVLSDIHDRWARFKSTLWFTAGFTLVFVLMGLSLSWISSVLGPLKPVLLMISGCVLAIFGLHLSGALEAFSWTNRLSAGLRNLLSGSKHIPDFSRYFPRGLHGFLFGAMFGLSWTPCVGPVLGGVLTYVASQERSAYESALFLLCFALGIALPLVIVSVAAEKIRPHLAWLKKHLRKVEYVTGVGLLFFGVYLMNQGRLSVPDHVAASGQVLATDPVGNQYDLSKPVANTVRMVFFYSETCPICRAMERYLPEFEKTCTSDRFQFIRVNVNLPANLVAASRFSIRAVPTVAVISPKGTEVARLIGYQTQSRLENAAETSTAFLCQNRVPVDPVLTPLAVPAATPSSGATCAEGANSC